MRLESTHMRVKSKCMHVSFTRKCVIFTRLRVEFIDTRACWFLRVNSSLNLLLCRLIQKVTHMQTSKSLCFGAGFRKNSQKRVDVKY
jgi:hypothetical protein